ncbi:MAG: ABC transporter permease [Gammaproteobacteria bacterium]|nr:ABC transporter permease [Gammaproteobacteria bacterium]
MNMILQIRSIASFTLLEALRNRLPWLVLAILALGLGISQFLGVVAITESVQVQVGFLGALLRLAAVVVVGLFVITSMAREFNDKVLELHLSLSITRGGYFLGKLGGYTLFSLLVSVLFSLLLLLYAPPGQVILWGLSLCAELLLVTAFSMLCLFTFSQVTVALSVVIAFYVLSRSIGAIQLMAYGPMTSSSGLSQQLAGWVIDGVAYLLPDLYRFTPSEWLIYSTGEWENLIPILVQTSVYLLLLAGAAMFDLYRRDL